METHLVQNEEETKALAESFSKTLKSDNLILLSGNLGAGKTAFSRFLIRSLCRANDLNVPSPTFTLVQTYEADIGDIHHYDLYRLENPEDVFNIGWEESLYQALTIVEWPEKISSLLPETYIHIRFEILDDTARKIEIEVKND